MPFSFRLFICLSVFLTFCLCVIPFFSLSVFLPFRLSVFICTSLFNFIFLSICLKKKKTENKKKYCPCIVAQPAVLHVPPLPAVSQHTIPQLSNEKKIEHNKNCSSPLLTYFYVSNIQVLTCNVFLIAKNNWFGRAEHDLFS